MVIPMLIKKNIKADLAATGFSFFQTKYIINPTSGTQQSVIILTAQFGVSSPLAFFTRTPQWTQISAYSEICSPQFLQYIIVPPIFCYSLLPTY